jgi:ubiquinone/menaquinone biosynthesis C-methylase UbiE
VSDPTRIRDYFETAAWRPSSGRHYLVRERTRLMRAQASALDVSLVDMTICDVGCGAGADLVAWREGGVHEDNLAATELVPGRAEAARRAAPGADIRCVDGFDLPFSSAAYDVCTASLVLSTIRSGQDRRRLLKEMARVTRSGGLVMVYDFVISKPWNRNVSAVTTRHLTESWRRPDEIRRAAPLLPALDVALRLPRTLRRPAIRMLPRTHRLWIWRIGPVESAEA